MNKNTVKSNRKTFGQFGISLVILIVSFFGGHTKALAQKTTFQFTSNAFVKDLIEWVTDGESVNGKYIVERRDGTEWIVEIQVKAKGQDKHSLYSKNIFDKTKNAAYRIKYVDAKGMEFYSAILKYEPVIEAVTFYPKSVNDKLHFSKPVSYEILNSRGLPLKVGKGNEVDCSDLPKGVYHVLYMNKNESFFKK